MDPQDLLELAACDDVAAFRRAVEADGLPVDAPSRWYGRWWSPKKGAVMGHELRTPLMVAALYGSTSVVEYILSRGGADVNLACGSDSATALHCAAASGAASAFDVAALLIAASADIEKKDGGGRKPADVVFRLHHSSSRKLRTALEALLRGESPPEEEEEEEKEKKKEYPVDATLPDINSGVYSTDEFRMYCFKVRPCSRAYTHDWTECPYAHPGENARRRDPRKHQYSCVPCPDFRKSGACRSGDACEYAHGVFESWLHPQQYRTRLCKDEVGCGRRVCFFAHRADELRTPSSSFPYLSSSPASAASSPRSTLPPLDLGAAAAMFLAQQQQQSLPWLSQSSRLKSDGELGIEEDYSVMSQLKPPKQSPPKQSLLSSAILNSSRASAFAAKRSQSFVDRGPATRSSATTACFGSVSPWGSPDGKLDWRIGGEELSKLRKSASFGIRGDGSRVAGGCLDGFAPAVIEEEEPDVSWVQSLVGDGKGRNGFSTTAYAGLSAWGDQQLYLEQGRIFA